MSAVVDLDGRRSLQETLVAFLADREISPSAGDPLVKAFAQLERLGILTRES